MIHRFCLVLFLECLHQIAERHYDLNGYGREWQKRLHSIRIFVLNFDKKYPIFFCILIGSIWYILEKIFSIFVDFLSLGLIQWWKIKENKLKPKGLGLSASFLPGIPGIWEEIWGQFYPNTTHNSIWSNTTDAKSLAELEFGLTGGPYDNYTAPRTNLHTQGGWNWSKARCCCHKGTSHL